MCNYFITFLSLVLEKFLRVYRYTKPWNGITSWRGGGDWENNFLNKKITRPILKGACA